MRGKENDDEKEMVWSIFENPRTVSHFPVPFGMACWFFLRKKENNGKYKKSSVLSKAAFLLVQKYKEGMENQ